MGWRLRPRRPSPGTVLGGVALVMATSGIAVAAIPGTDGAVTACYGNSGSLRVIDAEAGDSCRNGETSLRLASVDAAGKVGDADKLDGKDSAAFLASGAAAGGDLTGAYPNPSIRTGAVDSASVQDHSVRVRDLAKDAVGSLTTSLNVPAGGCRGVSFDLLNVTSSDGYVIVTPPDTRQFGAHGPLQVTGGLQSSPFGGEKELYVKVCNASSSDVATGAVKYNYLVLPNALR